VPDDDQPPPDDDDKFRPDAIAARIDKLGTETDSDRLAREEEQKLFERKKERKKGGGGLESAASKRLAKIGEGKVKRPSAAVDAIGGDPVLDRIGVLQKWLRQNQTVAIGAAVAALVATGAAVSVAAWHERRDAQASVLLAQAMADERGSIASAKDDADEDDTAAKALYPTFKSAAERRDASLAKYRAVESKYAGTGAAILARLAEAAILLDLADAASAKGAAAAYEDVRASALAAADTEVRGRALEGKGFANELLARTDAANQDRHLDDALTDFKALASVDGFKDLGDYHQARILLAKGDRAKSTELLKDLQKRVSDSKDGKGATSYLQLVVEDRLRELDPSAVPPKAPKGYGGAADALGGLGGNGGGPSHVDMNDPRIQDLIRQLREHPQQGAPPGPPGPANP
jgi:hypothetical protein